MCVPHTPDACLGSGNGRSVGDRGRSSCMPTSEVVGDGVIYLRRSCMPKSDLAGGEGGGEWDGSSRMPESELVGGDVIFLRRAHM